LVSNFLGLLVLSGVGWVGILTRAGMDVDFDGVGTSRFGTFLWYFRADLKTSICGMALELLTKAP
jgi:hypothetical protein